MASSVSVVASSAGTVNLQDPTINPQAAPISTPRQGGFTLRNRWKCANLTTANRSLFETTDWSSTGSGSDASLAATMLQAITVPKRTLVKDMTLFAVVGEAGPNTVCKFGGSAGSAVTLASDLNEVNVNVYAHAYKSASQSSLASSLVELCQIDTEDPDDASSDTHGWFDGSVLGQSASWSSLSVPTAAAMHLKMDLASTANTIDAATWDKPVYFPHGGFIVLRTDSQISADSVSTVIGSWSQEMVGTWEIQAACQYVPE
jgi:hypothetical protein